MASRIAIKEAFNILLLQSNCCTHSQCHKIVKGYAVTFCWQVYCDVKCVEVYSMQEL